jgi:hypothetical protein
MKERTLVCRLGHTDRRALACASSGPAATQIRKPMGQTAPGMGAKQVRVLAGSECGVGVSGLVECGGGGGFSSRRFFGKLTANRQAAVTAVAFRHAIRPYGCGTYGVFCGRKERWGFAEEVNRGLTMPYGNLGNPQAELRAIRQEVRGNGPGEPYANATYE